MSWLELNSAVILDFFLFRLWKLQKCPKNLGSNNHLSTYLNLKGYYIHSRHCSKFWSLMKTQKSVGLLLSCNQGTKFVVPFSSRSQVIIKKSTYDIFFLFKMMNVSLKCWCFHSNPFFERQKLSFVDFKMMTSEQENEEKRTRNSVPKSSLQVDIWLPHFCSGGSEKGL